MEFLVLLLGLKGAKSITQRRIRPRRLIRKYRRNLMFISKVVVELCELLSLIVVTFYKSFRWCLRTSLRLNQNKNSVPQSPSNVINIADYKKKRVS